MCRWHVSENSESTAKNCPTDNDAYGELDKSNLKFIYEQFLSRNGAFYVELVPYSEVKDDSGIV